MNLTKQVAKFLLAFLFVLPFLLNVGCSDTLTVDKTEFNLYYSGMTDIGPSMNAVISPPSYIGSKPHDFFITDVTLDGKSVVSQNFIMNADNGSIAITNTKDMNVGVYLLSVSCISNGKKFDFPSSISVNMLPPVPKGIKVCPDQLTVDYSDVLNPSGDTSLPMAQVKTDGHHISIKKYEIVKSAVSKYFKISSKGLISIVAGSDITPGIYSLSLKLTTAASSDKQGIFENALTVKVTSKPMALVYAPNSGKIEVETQQSPGTTFKSGLPQLKGSTDGLKYSIATVVPSTDKIKIDEKSGMLLVEPHHGFEVGNKFVVDVKVINQYCPDGKIFPQVFTLETVAFIKPIDNFSYKDASFVQSTQIEVQRDLAFSGDEVSFKFLDLAPELQGKLQLDHNGTISAPKGNDIPVGSYLIKVQASNPKGAVVAPFNLTIRKNPNFIASICYGNNLNLSPAENYANQYRVHSETELSALSLTPTIEPQGIPVTWSVSVKNCMAGTTIDAVTGKLSLKGWKDNQCGLLMVTATAGQGDEAYSVSTLVFFHFSTNVSVEYTPFVLQVSPKTGGSSVAPELIGVSDKSKFLLDYRRSFTYYNIHGVRSDGTPLESGQVSSKSNPSQFLRNLWDVYNADYASKYPCSYYDDKSQPKTIDLAKTLAYVDNSVTGQHKVVVSPNLWNDDGLANGIFIAQMTFVTNGMAKDLNGGTSIFPFAIWFDTQFATK